MRKGWKNCQLGDVCTLQRGFDLPKKCRATGPVPLMSSSGAIDFHNEAKVSGPGVVTGRSGSIGRVFFVDDDFWPLNTTLYVKDFHGNYPRFVYYLLLSFELQRFSTGSGVPTLNRNSVHCEKIEVPETLEEQKRIVAILDEAFAGIDTAIANTEKNLANARELFKRYLNRIFINRGAGWTNFKLDDVCNVERGSSPRPIKSYVTDKPEGVNWVKIGDTKGITKYIKSTKQKITPDGALKSRRVNPGDFILTNSMSFGKPYIMATSGYIHDGWFVLRLKDNVATDFFYYLLSSRLVQDQFKSLAAGSVVKNISSNLVKRAALPLPPKQEQLEIVEHIEQIVLQVQELEAIYQQKLTALAELKQSLLQKAFCGELTADKAASPSILKEEAVP